MKFKTISFLGLATLLSANTFAADFDMSTVECQAFTKVANGEREDLKNGLQTDQIIVSKNGRTLYSWDDGVFTLDKKHSLWSASKTVTATLVGIAIQKGDLKIDARLKDFFPAKMPNAVQQFYYDQITIDHLVSMSSGFKWDESYESNPFDSSFMTMLYGEGNKDMKAFALSQELEISPGLKWNYSGGNSVILMAILEKVYGNKNFADELLFKPLGMTSAQIERDAAGTLIGSSYVYMTPADMQKLGNLYLNEGVINGTRYLPAAWIRKAQVVADALSRPDTKSDAEYVKTEGVFSQRAFWLNQSIPSLKIENEFKNSPADMYFAAGHYGQMMIILPSQYMVITTTGHSSEYWSKIDKLVANAVACFSKKAPLDPATTFGATTDEDKRGFIGKMRFGGKMLSHNIVQSVLAKELCSCQYISGLNFDQCLERSSLPVSTDVLKKYIKFENDTEHQTLKVEPRSKGAILSLGKADDKTANFVENNQCLLQ